MAFIFTIATYTLPVYDGYVYPPMANVIGFTISVIPLLPIPVFMVKELLSHQGSFIHVSVCVCVCVCVCGFVCVCVCVCGLCVCECACVRTSVFVCAHAHVCV